MEIGRKSNGMIRQLFQEIDPMACQESGEGLCTCYLRCWSALEIVREALGFRRIGIIGIEEAYSLLSKSLPESAVQRVWGATAGERLVVSEGDLDVLFELFREAHGTICHKADGKICDCHQRSYDAVQAISAILGCIELTSQQIAEAIRKALLPFSLEAFVKAHHEVKIEMLARLAYARLG